MSGPSARARSRASSSRLFCKIASMVRRWMPRSGAAATAASAACGAEHRHRLAPIRHRLVLCPLDLIQRHGAGRGDAIEHAVAGVARGSDGAVGAALLRRLRQRDQRAPPRPASGGAAPCRNRPARRRARLRDCRHRAQGSDRARGSRPWSVLRSISSARTIWRSLAVKLRSVRGSRSRATCMVSVDAPETMRPLTSNWESARPSANGSTP